MSSAVYIYSALYTYAGVVFQMRDCVYAYVFQMKCCVALRHCLVMQHSVRCCKLSFYFVAILFLHANFPFINLGCTIHTQQII